MPGLTASPRRRRQRIAAAVTAAVVLAAAGGLGLLLEGPRALVAAVVLGVGCLALGALAVPLLVGTRGAHARQDAVEEARQVLVETELTALEQLREAQRLREDLISSVSHEFRTPLAAIHGTAATLRQHGERIPPVDREVLLDGMLEHAERLGRLLSDMLGAASAGAPPTLAVVDLTEVLRRAAGRRGEVVHAAAGLCAHVDPQAAERLVDALLGHGRSHAVRGTVLRLNALPVGEHVALVLDYESDSASPEHPARLLAPFGSQDSARTGRAASLGLYLARRLAEVSGGDASAEVSGRDVRVTVRLRAVREAEPGPASESNSGRLSSRAVHDAAARRRGTGEQPAARDPRDTGSHAAGRRQAAG